MVKQDIKPDINRFGIDAADWLKRWDAGETVWSIEMGGLGPGYEQCIQITATEILRHLLETKYDATLWNEKDHWKEDREQMEWVLLANPIIDKLGLSGAQFGAATNLASNLYRRGPQCLADDIVKDRLIQVNKNFP